MARLTIRFFQEPSRTVSCADDPELANQFTEQNINRMREGNAPKARQRDIVGKRASFELHHVEWVSKGGEVYDVDNLRVNTPKNHIDNHR